MTLTIDRRSVKRTIKQCQAKDPATCPYHGAYIRLETALNTGDANAVFEAQREIENLEAANIHDDIGAAHLKPALPWTYRSNYVFYISARRSGTFQNAVDEYNSKNPQAPLSYDVSNEGDVIVEDRRGRERNLGPRYEISSMIIKGEPNPKDLKKLTAALLDQLDFSQNTNARSIFKAAEETAEQKRFNSEYTSIDAETKKRTVRKRISQVKRNELMAQLDPRDKDDFARIWHDKYPKAQPIGEAIQYLKKSSDPTRIREAWVVGAIDHKGIERVFAFQPALIR